jgi:hypothetical protein
LTNQLSRKSVFRTRSTTQKSTASKILVVMPLYAILAVASTTRAAQNLKQNSVPHSLLQTTTAQIDPRSIGPVVLAEG